MVQTVLLVDDDAMQLKLTSLRLRDAGFAVETASSGDEALQKAKEHVPDAVLSDVLMADLDGFGLCRALRKEPSLARVPVILLSAHYRGAPDQTLATRVGADALVPRTADFDAELRALRASLARAQPSTVSADEAATYEQHLRTNANQLTRLVDRARRAEQRYRALFENANDTITILNKDGIILDVNARWRDVLGRDPESLVGHHIRDFASRGYEHVVSSDYSRSLKEGRTIGELQHADGRTIYMEFSNTIFDAENEALVLAIGRDVTEQIRIDRERAKAEERFRSLVERIPDVIWTTRVASTMEFMTNNIVKVLGYTPEEIYAFTPEQSLDGVHPDDRQAVVDAFTALVQTGVHFDLECRHRHKLGHWIWIRNRSTGLYERDGVHYIEGMMTNITDRKRMEETLQQAQKMEAIGQLTGGIAHDFNNILAAILANSQFLIEDLSDSDPRQQDAREIKLGAERAAGLTRQLLAFSRRQALEPTVANLNTIIGSIEKMLRRLIGEDIELAVELAPELGSVKVDVGQIEQVIMNLAVNARDAMPKGGRLALATANVEVASSSDGLKAGRYVLLSVLDNGTGMDHATMRRLFEPFFTTKEVGKGTGLGLSTCYGIIKQSGGSIEVSSQLGSGSLFEIYLPRVDAIVTEPKLRAPSIEMRGDETILLVEDDERVRTAVKRMLEQKGYHVLVASNARAALALAAEHEGKIALVLSDLVMPGGNGAELMVQIKQRWPSVRALFMSGYSDHPVFRDPSVRSESGFIQKPFGADALAKKIRQLLDAPADNRAP